MYQQGSLELLHANKMAETIMRLQQEQQQQGQNYVLPPGVVIDRRPPDDNRRSAYEQAPPPTPSSAAVSFAHAQQGALSSSSSTTANGNGGGVGPPQTAAGTDNGDPSSSLFVVMPRTEYDFMKQELAMLKQSLIELKTSIGYEIQQLKSDSRTLKQQVDGCSCSSIWRGNGKDPADIRRPTWTGDGTWNGRTYMNNQVQGSCSPSASSPDNADQSGMTMGFNGTSYFGGGLPPPLAREAFGSPQSISRSDRGKLVQLLSNYDVWVNKMNLQIIVNEAPTRKDGAALFVLRRIIPLVFAWEELACSRGQGLNCKTTDDVFGKVPLDPTKVAACKAFMRKFCVDNGCLEPTERSINQTFSHQVNYARRRLKAAAHPACSLPKKSKRLRRDLQMLVPHPRTDVKEQVKTEHFMQI